MNPKNTEIEELYKRIKNKFNKFHGTLEKVVALETQLKITSDKLYKIKIEMNDILFSLREKDLPLLKQFTSVQGQNE